MADVGDRHESAKIGVIPRPRAMSPALSLLRAARIPGTPCLQLSSQLPAYLNRIASLALAGFRPAGADWNRNGAPTGCNSGRLWQLGAMPALWRPRPLFRAAARRARGSQVRAG